jgi:hypothetical protein
LGDGVSCIKLEVDRDSIVQVNTIFGIGNVDRMIKKQYRLVRYFVHRGLTFRWNDVATSHSWALAD